MNEMDEEVIDIRELFTVIKKKAWIIILITCIAAGVGVFSASQMTISYKASAKLYVSKNSDMASYYDKVEMMYYTSFMDTFKEIITIDDFLINTLQKHNIDVSPNEVKGGLSFISSETTPIFTITYSTWEEEGASEILNAICDEFLIQAKSIFPEAIPQILDSAKVYTIYPNKTKKVAVYTLGGFAFSIMLVLGIHFLDDTVKSNDRLKKVLPIPVLGELPKQEKSYKEERI